MIYLAILDFITAQGYPYLFLGKGCQNWVSSLRMRSSNRVQRQTWVGCWWGWGGKLAQAGALTSGSCFCPRRPLRGQPDSAPTNLLPSSQGSKTIMGLKTQRPLMFGIIDLNDIWPKVVAGITLVQTAFSKATNSPQDPAQDPGPPVTLPLPGFSAVVLFELEAKQGSFLFFFNLASVFWALRPQTLYRVCGWTGEGSPEGPAALRQPRARGSTVLPGAAWALAGHAMQLAHSPLIRGSQPPRHWSVRVTGSSEAEGYCLWQRLACCSGNNLGKCQSLVAIRFLSVGGLACRKWKEQSTVCVLKDVVSRLFLFILYVVNQCSMSISSI